MVKIITDREKHIIDKKLSGLRLTQNESNILSKFVRPKLREISNVNAKSLLQRLKYNQKAKSIENKLKKLLLGNVKEIQAIVLYGSAIQTNYERYNDIDVLIITKRKTWDEPKDKYEKIIELKNLAKKAGLELDIQIISKDALYYQYPHNPSLIYQFKDCKIVYGKIKIPSKAELSKLDLRMKLDWSEIDDEDSEGREIYQSLRNVLLVRLLLNEIVDNGYLREMAYTELGKNIISKLVSNTASRKEKKLILQYIKELVDKTNNEIKEAPWEKIVLEKL